MKDVIAESATASTVTDNITNTAGPNGTTEVDEQTPKDEGAFTLANFIPLLAERVVTVNPYTRVFLLNWVVLLDSIPGLEMVTYLTSFLGNLFKFLCDHNPDVRALTHRALDGFLSEIRRLSKHDPKTGTSSQRDSKESSDYSVSINSVDVSIWLQSNYFLIANSFQQSRAPVNSNDAEDLRSLSAAIHHDDWRLEGVQNINYVGLVDILTNYLQESYGKQTSNTDLQPLTEI